MIDLERLREAIAEKRGGDSIRTAAKQIGVDFGTLARIEKGQTPTLDTYAKICAWLGVSLDLFVRGKVATPWQG